MVKKRQPDGFINHLVGIFYGFNFVLSWLILPFYWALITIKKIWISENHTGNQSKNRKSVTESNITYTNFRNRRKDL